jgi:hypothetical protein
MILCEKCGYTTDTVAIYYFGECHCNKLYAVANKDAIKDKNGAWYIPDSNKSNRNILLLKCPEDL